MRALQSHWTFTSCKTIALAPQHLFSYKHFIPFLTYQLGDGIITSLAKRLKHFLSKKIRLTLVY